MTDEKDVLLSEASVGEESSETTDVTVNAPHEQTDSAANSDEREVLLSVQHLEQFFKMGGHQLKAVNDVSFDIYKGEVFGLVGESGCGKTTTGRSIIRLYDITGGSVYFEGQRICAGVNTYKEAIKQAKEDADLKIKAIMADEPKGPERDAHIAEVKAVLSDEIAKQKAEIKSAKHDHKHCNSIYARKMMNLVREKFNPLIKAEQEAIDEKVNEVTSRFNEEVEACKAEIAASSLSDDEKKKTEAQKVAEIRAKYAPEFAEAKNNEKKKALETEMRHELHLASKDRIMNKMQMIFQDPIASLDPRMMVKDIIAEGLQIRGIRDKKVIEEKVFNVLELVGLVREHAGRYPHEFSGGQRQRIGIARSIVLNPDLIIADEPISALDVSIQAQVINLLNELRERLGLTIMFIAHDLSVVKYFSDRIAVMYFGKIVELTTSDELFAHPLHPYTKSLLSAIPLPDPHYEKKRKRITYNPLNSHDYSKQQPYMQEVVKGHFIYCNDEELERYKQEIAEIDSKKAENTAE